MNFPLNMRVRAAALIIQDGMVLVAEFYEEGPGLHYVLPGGAVNPRETIREAVAREVREEACLNVEVGRLVLTYEYAPHRDPIPREIPPALTLVFACQPAGGEARLPDCPDPGQTGVRWIPLDELDEIRLSPPIHKQILDYAYNNAAPLQWIEEWRVGGSGGDL